MFSIFDCHTRERVSEETYALFEEAGHDYHMNQGKTYVGPVIAPYIIVAHLPACSAVLYIRGEEVTILREDTANFCNAFAAGYIAGSGQQDVEHRGTINLPKGNPALSYKTLLSGKRS